MRRAPVVISGTLAGVIGLLSFHSKSAALNLNTFQSGLSSSKNAASGPSSTTTPATGSSTSTTTPAGTSTAVPPTTTPNTKSNSGASTTIPQSPTTTVPPTTTTAPSASKTATGPVVNYYFGTVSVSVTVTRKKITNISIASLDDGGNPRSQQIDQISLPQLEQQALAANSANIQGISGATYTSQGFAQSLQGALSKVGL